MSCSSRPSCPTRRRGLYSLVPLGSSLSVSLPDRSSRQAGQRYFLIVHTDGNNMYWGFPLPVMSYVHSVPPLSRFAACCDWLHNSRGHEKGWTEGLGCCRGANTPVPGQRYGCQRPATWMKEVFSRMSRDCLPVSKDAVHLDTGTAVGSENVCLHVCEHCLELGM